MPGQAPDRVQAAVGVIDEHLAARLPAQPHGQLLGLSEAAAARPDAAPVLDAPLAPRAGNHAQLTARARAHRHGRAPPAGPLVRAARISGRALAPPTARANTARARSTARGSRPPASRRRGAPGVLSTARESTRARRSRSRSIIALAPPRPRA